MSEPKLKCKNCNTFFEKKKLECPVCNSTGITSLYKYVPYTQHSLSILINKNVWFGKAAELNDPFEFRFVIEPKNLNINMQSLESAIEDSKKLGVFCLSDIPDNILMWSHYTGQHYGFCIEFRRAKNNDLGGDGCVPVIYQNEIPVFNPTQLEINKTFARIATTKSTEWKYENEWRMLSKEIGGKTYPIPGEITSIIFGSRMFPENKKTIKNILKESVNYKQAEISKKSFSITIE